ncbi:SPOR domain-containing protein [Azoarcus sp. KH32C]|uniref:SPOR domain-containing protein n=1 Tax=Azoarcus sp. KH32C TaxID=748247 RepID=UPI0002386BCF|nr:SPOR domain-containing protein [Azoarcus sp. KH32C]BAL26528.1 peptidoglycan-binding protein [Azoarcus sp. KH32C]
MKTGRGPGPSAGGVKPTAANKAAVLQAAAGTVVLLLLALAWVALGDAPRSAPAAEPPQAQARPVAVPDSAPKAISQSASGAVSSDSSTAPPAAPVPSAEAAAAASAAPAPVVTTPAQPASPAVSSSPAAAAQAPAVQTALAPPAPAAQVAPVQPPVCEPAPQDANCTGTKRFPPAPPGNGFMVEVGTFTDAEKAETLRRELARHGQSAYLQSRVLLGPFPDRKSAQQAEEKIRRERKLGGMILPPHKP